MRFMLTVSDLISIAFAAFGLVGLWASPLRCSALLSAVIVNLRRLNAHARQHNPTSFDVRLTKMLERVLLFPTQGTVGLSL